MAHEKNAIISSFHRLLARYPVRNFLIISHYYRHGTQTHSFFYPYFSTYRYFQHFVKRVKHSKEAIEAKKQKEQSKIREYLALTDDILTRVRLCFISIIELSTLHNTEEE
jgi:hypothetical protein